MRDLLEDLRRGIPAPSDVVLHGPRGNGKTVLLRWLEDVIADIPEVDVLSHTPSGIASRAQLAEQLLPPAWWNQFAPDGFSFMGIGIRWRPGQPDPPAPEEALAARARQKPLVMLLDEAHTLNPEIGQALLNAAQQVGRRRPFLLVLAGTPRLEPHLRTMAASFWSRAEQLLIGRLDDEAASKAIRKPLEEERVAITEEALARIVAEAHGYPFFLQLWGRIAWNRMSESPAGGSRRIARAEVEAGLEEFRNRRDLYYRERYDELKEGRLLRAARAVADAFAAASVLDDLTLEAAVERGLPSASREKIEATESALRQLGYIWRSGASPEWEPGIPSLMDYIRNATPALADS